MNRRNLFTRASEGDPEAEREVLARLRRKHTVSVEDHRIELCNALMREAVRHASERHAEARRCLVEAARVRWPRVESHHDIAAWVGVALRRLVLDQASTFITATLDDAPEPGSVIYGAAIVPSPR